MILFVPLPFYGQLIILYAWLQAFMDFLFYSILYSKPAAVKENTFLRKFITCLVAGLTTIALLLILGNSGSFWWFPPELVFSLVGVSFLLAVLYPFVWQYREKKKQTDSPAIYGILYTIIRYSIAFNLASFGWKKMFGLQFVVPVSIASKPMNQQSGEWLTWYYFGHSAVYGFIIALIQITGSYFLLFRKTLLAAAVVLFVFMLNLMLINIFYEMNAGALIQSVLLTMAIAFLILSDYKKLTEVFFKIKSNVPAIKQGSAFAKSMVRLSAIVLSLLFAMYLKYVFLN